MADVVSRETRSRMMRGIQAKDTQPELLLRRGLHRLGFRFRVHDKSLPGCPDIVFPKYRAVLFAHGCFWHGHSCHLFRWPSTRPDFWASKINANRARDCIARQKLIAAGWRHAVVWECALKGRSRRPEREVVLECADWLRSGATCLEIPE